VIWKYSIAARTGINANNTNLESLFKNSNPIIMAPNIRPVIIRSFKSIIFANK
jgi:hypothetical protein